MIAKSIARNLSTIQRNRLIEYVGGPQSIDIHRPTDTSLRAEKLLQPASSNRTNPRPSDLMLTELGREVACVILGQHADALVACGLTDRVFTESQLLEAIKVSSRRIPCLEQIERFVVDAESAGAYAPNTPTTV